MSSTRFGVICCLCFVSLEAFQAVYLGALFQAVDSFLIGAWVFGISVVSCFFTALVLRPEELAASFRCIKLIVVLNILAAITWTTYFTAIQLVEPAVVFTIFSGMVPLGTVLAASMGMEEARSPKNAWVTLGNGIIFLSLLLLVGTTIAGMSGFVRGDSTTALLGVLLSAISGFCTALVVLYSVRLSKQGVGPLTQFGLRFVLYTIISIMAFRAGIDSKATTISGPELPMLVGIGLIVIAFPLYLVQKAVPLIPAPIIAAITALGPPIVFSMQLIEGRVNYAPATFVGLSIYVGGALIAIFGLYWRRR